MFLTHAFYVHFTTAFVFILCRERVNVDVCHCTNVFILATFLNCSDMMFQKKFDTVIMNPPFGTKNNKGMVFMTYNLEF